MGNRSKGSKRDNECRGLYEDAGFVTEKSTPMRYGRTDWFGLFDFMAVRDDTIHLVQVKHAGSVSGLAEMVEWYKENAPPCMECVYAIYHKGEGWRLVIADPESSGKTDYETVYDERKDEEVGRYVDTDLNLGEGLSRYLARSQ